MGEGSQPRVWLDLDNSPHVLFFAPLIDALQGAGVAVTITAKPHAQTIDLARLHGLQVVTVGRSNARRRIMKAAVTLKRTVDLRAAMEDRAPAALFLSHGSRSGVLAARLLRIPAWTFLDYEHVEARSLAIGTTRFWFPDLLRTASLPPSLARRATFYPGLKENIYLAGWPLRPQKVRQELRVPAESRWVVTRPPATSAHYASEKSWHLWKIAISRLLERREAVVHVLPRDQNQGETIRGLFADQTRLFVLMHAVDGPSLVAAADLVVGGGGTMNREAAVLGTPVWSVFNGPTPYIDEQLSREGRLRWIRCEQDIADAQLTLWRRPEPRGGGADGRSLIVHAILDAVGVTPVASSRTRARRVLSGA
jgi:hypothetical protein